MCDSESSIHPMTRQLIEAKREGYVAACEASVRKSRKQIWDVAARQRAIDAAAKLYPITITRPRVLTIGACKYKVVDGALYGSHPRPYANPRRPEGTLWKRLDRTREQTLELLCLWDNPTEIVEII